MTDKHSITIDGAERELFMSYGLLNELTKIVGSIELAPAIGIDPDLREAALKAVLAERKASGKVTKAVKDIDDLEISIDDIESTLDWVTEAVLSFFVRSLRKMAERVEANKDSLEALKSSLVGLQASPSATA